MTWNFTVDEPQFSTSTFIVVPPTSRPPRSIIGRTGHRQRALTTGAPRALLDDGGLPPGAAVFVARPSLPDHFSLERFFDYAIDMLCVADASGYFLKVNRAFERGMGYTRDELLSRP